MLKKASPEHLFDIFHLQGNLVELEWHSLENGDLETADLARLLRHDINRYLLIGEEQAEPQYLCALKHTLSARTELMELMEKWKREGRTELINRASEGLDKLGQKLIDLIQKIRKEELKIKT